MLTGHWFAHYPARHYARPMIDLGSIVGLLEHDQEPHAYCARRDRWQARDL